MDSNISNRQSLAFVPIVPTDYAVALGVAGFVDTDCTASIPLSASFVLIEAYPENGTVDVGVRAVGEAVDTKLTVGPWVRISRLSNHAGGHLDLYRNATVNAHYTVLGYWQ